MMLLSVSILLMLQLLQDVNMNVFIHVLAVQWTDVHLVKAAPIPAGGSLVVVGGDQKVVMEPGDVLTVKSDTARADVWVSVVDTMTSRKE